MIDYLSLAWQVTRQLAPWLLFGALVAGLLHVLLPPNFVQRHLGKGNFKNIVKASLFGVPMPLCSCGVIPAAIGLKKDGASDSATMGFLISTPQTGVDSIMVSAAFLGLPFALFKVVSAFVTGLIGGTITNIGISEKQRAGTPAADKKESAPCRTISTCIRNLLEFAVNELLYPVWKWIAVGILISAAISFFLPENALAEKAWATGLAGMFLMLLISLPLYVCATASVPIVASLVHAGMPTGAALVFLMAG
ncbi:MAG: permease, partial [Candidatus Pacebacteria bacterium]|nr:permease [Candidatus Paceibacterota bacterium]